MKEDAHLETAALGQVQVLLVLAVLAAHRVRQSGILLARQQGRLVRALRVHAGAKNLT